MIDYNCFAGNWPFHKIRHNKFEDIIKMHKEYNIEFGYISSLESVFYNDPYESELDLYNSIKGSGYKQIMTINPALDICIDTVNRGIEELDIKGVRITPFFHDYNINDNCVKELLKILRKHKLPLYINIRLEDERCSYLLHPYPVKTEDLTCFIEDNNDIDIMLCTISFGEVMKMKEVIFSHSNVTFDSSGFKDRLFALPELRKEGLGNKVRFGSCAPLFAFESAYLIYTEEN